MNINAEKKNEPDRILTACAVALKCLSQLLMEAHRAGDYENSCVAAEGIKALSDVLSDMNL